MQYLGVKSRISKQISEIINKYSAEKPFVSIRQNLFKRVLDVSKDNIFKNIESYMFINHKFIKCKFYKEEIK